MQGLLLPFGGVAFVFYGFARFVANPVVVELKDTKETQFSFQLQEGILWDRAIIHQHKINDPKFISSREITTVRPLEIEHKTLN